MAGFDAKLVASDVTHIVRVVPAPAKTDAPNRLAVFDRATSRRIASWPLLDAPARVAVYGDLVILSGATRHELYALRLADGRIAQIGIARAGDRPLIGPAGVLYQDDLDLAKHRTAPAQRTLKLVPLSSVRQELARPFTTVRMYMSYSKLAPAATGSPRAVAPASTPPYRGADPPRPLRLDRITAMAMNGSRVALAVHDAAGRCDYVLFWNVQWHYVTRLTRASGATCLPTHAPGGITNVAIAGSRAIWTVTYGGTTRIVGAMISDCQEWVVARPVAGLERVAGLAGDGGILAYAFAPSRTGRRLLSAVPDTQSSVGVVPAQWGGVSVKQFQTPLLGLSVYDGRIAALSTGGTVSITTRGGALIRQLRVGPARAVALRGNLVAALSNRGTLDVFSISSGERLHSWRVARNASSLDVQYGIALLAAGRDVYAVNLATGWVTNLFHAPARVAAQIEAPGAVIQYNLAGHGHLGFIPLSRIEASVR